jgi:hypothetical protein
LEAARAWTTVKILIGTTEFVVLVWNYTADVKQLFGDIGIHEAVGVWSAGLRWDAVTDTAVSLAYWSTTGRCCRHWEAVSVNSIYEMWTGNQTPGLIEHF